MATENENVPPVSPAVSPGEVDKNASPDAVPPGVEAGGIWGVNHYRGPTTGTATLVGFLCFCIPGLLMLIFALDNREAYKVNGKIYSPDGMLLGDATSGNFYAAAPRASTMAR